jgi:diaminohydroxyphosphoribosylaminopyrimidine deaminase/5-amino-6-(5-phosphoribosylamino)uracil reductase
MALTPLDKERVDQALTLAEEAIGRSDPNPRVGCIIGLPDGTILGKGSTQAAGSAHAEAMALRDAAHQGRRVDGATAWVTLEPCAHHGRTPPCSQALVDAGLARVVFAMEDPNPLVSGRGVQRLRSAGIEVETGTPEQAERAKELNIGFISRHTRGRPWIRVKTAITLDGRTAQSNGLSQWITGQSARTDGHAWRKRAGAVLTGIGTVLTDDPRLDVRLVQTDVQPLRVVVDSLLRTPSSARILNPPGSVLLATTPAAGASPRSEVELWRSSTRAHRVDLHELLTELARREVNEVHVEAGGTLNGALHEAGLVDEWLVYVAPLFLGEGRGVLQGVGSLALADARRYQWREIKAVGEDLRLLLRPAPAVSERSSVGKIDRKHGSAADS